MVAQMERAVRRVCDEVRDNTAGRAWTELSEPELLFELVACILGSRVSYELAKGAASAIRKSGLIDPPLNKCRAAIEYESRIRAVLRQPLNTEEWGVSGRRYPFPGSRASYVARTVAGLYCRGGSIAGRLLGCSTAQEARRVVVGTAVGVGPKQASLFLRNIGFSDDLAVLDSHVLEYMRLIGLSTWPRPLASSLRTYETSEHQLRTYAMRLGETLGRLDLAIWIVMRATTRRQSH